MKHIRMVLVGLALLLLAGCVPGAADGGAVQAVQQYYQAIIAQQPDAQAKVTCAAFAETARVELDSFQGVKSELKGLACRVTGQQGETTLVKCDGKIEAAYGDQKMEFPLADRIHQVKQENGVWKVCGY